MIYSHHITQYLERQSVPQLDIRAALIDMDGTLYHSMPRHALAWQQLMAEVGISVSIDEFFRFEGRTGASTIDILFRRHLGRAATDHEKDSLYRRKTELFAAMPPVEVMPGAQEMIETLRLMGITRVLVTGSGQNTLLSRLDSDFPRGFAPDMRVTSRSVTHGKPHPEPYLMAMQMASVKPWQSIVVENAPLGVEAGHASGAFTIGINTGPLQPGELTEAGADIELQSMEEFAQALPIILSEAQCITRL